MFTSIFWDNDGVLADTERLFYLATKEILGRVGIEFDEQTFIRLSLIEGVGGWKLAQDRGISADEISRLREKRDRLYSEFLTTEKIEIDGVGDVLAKLQHRFTMGVVTSSKRIHYEQMHVRTGLRKYFDFELVRSDYQKSKPAPEPYLLALKKTKSAAHECLVIEDSARGLAAAKAAGLTCWIIPNEFTAGSDFSTADRVLESIAQIPCFVAETASSPVPRRL